MFDVLEPVSAYQLKSVTKLETIVVNVTFYANLTLDSETVYDPNSLFFEATSSIQLSGNFLDSVMQVKNLRKYFI